MNKRRFVICYFTALGTGVCFYAAGIAGLAVAVAVPVCSIFVAMMLSVDNTPIQVKKKVAE